MSDHADTTRALQERLERCLGNNIYLTPKEGWAIVARCDTLENALREMALHARQFIAMTDYLGTKDWYSRRELEDAIARAALGATP